MAIERMHAPDLATTARYRAAYAEYQRLAKAMREPWGRLQQLEQSRAL